MQINLKMALLHSTQSEKKIYNQPWYKERLRTKYIKSLGPNDTSKFLQGKNWTFMKDGLDDFRDGLPPPVHGDDILLKGSKGLSPNVQGSSDNISAVKQPAVRGRFTKEEVCYSRATPLQQQRRDHIEEIEYGLKQHPLALYPHLEECLPPEMFEDVVDILDPEMNLASDDEDNEEYTDNELSTTTTPHGKSRQSNSSDEKTFSEENTMESQDEGKVRNPYRWLPRKEEKDRKDKKKAAEKKLHSPSEDEHIKDITKEFCDWVSGLGGESNNIEESTITSLFASGYETKPALSVPIHVVELTNVPPELRMSAVAPPPPEQQQTGIKEEEERKQWTLSGKYEPSWVKFKYGAWYLKPKTWKKRFAEEPLQDPKELKDQEKSEAKKKSDDLDYDLAPMHGSRAFMEFIDRKSCRKPEFLERVADIQEKQEAEEKARLEAELAKQRKQLNQRANTEIKVTEVAQ